MVQAKSTSKRKTSAIDVPAKGEDSAERKRVLNVLAQRRYRQRRKQHVISLEAEVEQRKPPTTPSSPQTPSDQDSNHGARSNSSRAPAADALASSIDDFSSPDQASFSGTSLYDSQQSLLPAKLDLTDHNQILVDPLAQFDNTFIDFQPDSSWDASLMLPGTFTDSPNSSTNSSSSSYSSGITCSMMSIQNTITPPRREHTWTFPDEANIQILQITLLKAALTVARCLNVEDRIWQLEATSPFSDPSSFDFSHYTHLPANLQPTPAQLTFPHHPAIDIMPWPAVRDKLIMVFAQPEELRPKVAASPTALVDFVYDIEDDAEGIRVWGEDPCSEKNWEIGEQVFKRWWWAFDRESVRRSNEMRKLRGARLLSMRGAVLGEVD